MSSPAAHAAHGSATASYYDVVHLQLDNRSRPFRGGTTSARLTNLSAANALVTGDPIHGGGDQLDAGALVATSDATPAPPSPLGIEECAGKAGQGLSAVGTASSDVAGRQDYRVSIEFEGAI